MQFRPRTKCRRRACFGLKLLLETLAGRHNATETRYLLAVVAALKGHPRLAEVLEDLECVHQECPGCGEFVYPEQLQRVAEDTEPDPE